MKKVGKKILYWALIIFFTTYIVGTSVNIAIKISKISEYEKSNNSSEELIKKSDKTKNFNIEYKEETYVLKDNDGTYKVKNRRNIPVITSSEYQEAGNKISDYLIQVSDENWSKIKESSDSYFEGETSDKIVGINLIMSTVVQNSKYFSFVIEREGSLGQESWNKRFGYTFDTSSGNLLNLSDITNDFDNLVENIYNNISNYISKQEYSAQLDENWQLKLKELIQEEGNWHLTDEGIEFNFDKYSFGPGSIDSIKYEIKYTDLNDLILDEYKKAQ